MLPVLPVVAAAGLSEGANLMADIAVAGVQLASGLVGLGQFRAAVQAAARDFDAAVGDLDAALAANDAQADSDAARLLDAASLVMTTPVPAVAPAALPTAPSSVTVPPARPTGG